MNTRDHLDSALPAADRASALLAQMTLREKAHRLTSVPVWWIVTPDGPAPPELADTLEKSPGHIDFVVDPGEIRLWIAQDSAAESVGATVRVVGDKRPLASSERAFFSDVRVDRLGG